MPYHRECKGCGGSFQTPDSRRVFCGKACFEQFRQAKGCVACAGCGKLFKRNRTNRAGNGAICSQSFCSRACAGTNGPGKQVFACKRCGRGFEAYARGISKPRAFCSMKCRFPNPPAPRNCGQCGKSFRRKSRSRYCSKACQFESQRDQVSMTCLACDKAFSVPRAREFTARFCSKPCWKRSTRFGETGIEAKVRHALESLSIAFIQEEHRFPYWLDFFLPDHDIAIEADGDYWHGLDEGRDNRRDEYLLSHHGIRTIRLTESEINGADDLARLISSRLAELHVKVEGSAKPLARQRRLNFG